MKNNRKNKPLRVRRCAGAISISAACYSPELNRIEKLWHTVKHHWMDVKCRTSKILEAELADIFQKFGSDYKFEFYD